jgi:hypothetical protein
MNTKRIYTSANIIIANILLAVQSAFAMSGSDCKAPCTDFNWLSLCRITKAAPVVTIMPPVQEYMLFDIVNPGIICPDTQQPATPPKQTYKYGSEKKEHVKYEIEVGAKWETFGLTEKVSGDKVFIETKGAEIEVVGYCRHVSADIAKSDKITTVEAMESCLLTTLRWEEKLHTYSLFYRSPAVPQSPDDPNCRTRCDVLF